MFLCTCYLDTAGEKETKPLDEGSGEYLGLSSGPVIAESLLLDKWPECVFSDLSLLSLRQGCGRVDSSYMRLYH